MSMQGVTDFIVAGPPGQVQAGPAGSFQAAPAGHVVTGEPGHVPIDTRAAMVPIDTSQARIPYAPVTAGDSTAIAGGTGGGSTAGGVGSTAQVGGAGSSGVSVTGGAGGGGSSTGGGASASGQMTGSVNPSPSTGGGKVESYSAGPGQPIMTTEGGRTTLASPGVSAPPMGAGPGRVVTDRGAGSSQAVSFPPVGISPVIAAGHVITAPPMGIGAAPTPSGFTPISPGGYVMPHNQTNWHGPGIGHTMNWPAKNTLRLFEEKGWEPVDFDPMWIPTGDGYEASLMIDPNKGESAMTRDEAKKGAYYDFSTSNEFQQDRSSSVTIDNSRDVQQVREFNPDFSTERTLRTENIRNSQQDVDRSSEVTMDLSQENVENNRTEVKQITENENTSTISYETSAEYNNEKNFVNDVDNHRTSKVENTEEKHIDASNTKFVETRNVHNNPDNSVTYNVEQNDRTYSEDNSRNVVNNVEQTDNYNTEYTFETKDLSTDKTVRESEVNYVTNLSPEFDFSRSLDVTYVNPQAPELGNAVMAASA